MLRVLTKLQQCNNLQQPKKLLLHPVERLCLQAFQSYLQQCNNKITIKELFEKNIYIYTYIRVY